MNIVSNTRKNISIIISSIMLPTISFSQGVRDSCVGEYCGGGNLTWFWIVGVSWVVLYAFYKLALGNVDEKRESISFLISALKAIVLFVGIPTMAFFIFGGKLGDGGEAAVFTFFGVLLIFMFSESFGKWVFGEDDD